MCEVQLFIYDLSRGLARPLAGPIFGLNVHGVWHTSIVVFGKEHYFSDCGIKIVKPGTTSHGHHVQTKVLGQTKIDSESLKIYLHQLSQNQYVIVLTLKNTYNKT